MGLVVVPRHEDGDGHVAVLVYALGMDTGLGHRLHFALQDLAFRGTSHLALVDHVEIHEFCPDNPRRIRMDANGSGADVAFLNAFVGDAFIQGFF